MNKTIAIYDLLGLIKDGKAPQRIKLNKVIFEYTGDDYLYKENNEEHWIFSSGYTDKYMWLKNFLDAEVEILDEEDEFIETNNYISNVGTVDDGNIENYVHILFEQQNTLIHNQKILIEKLKEKE